MKTKWCWSPKILTKIECSLATFSHGYDLQKKNWDGLPNICLRFPVARCAGCRLRRWTVPPPPPPLPHRALELGDEGQLLFWHFPSFLWTEIASAIPEWSIKSLLRGVKWHCLPKTAQFDQKRTNFFGMGWVSQISIRFGHRSLASVKTHGSNSVQNGLYSLLCWHN